MMKINWDHPVIWFFLGTFLIAITVMCLPEKPKETKQKIDAVYSIEIHDGDSVVIYKNHYRHGK